jgi:DNA repair exonuclease SbcCD nuclease subunit
MRNIKIVSISDIHFGRRWNPTGTILEHMYEWLITYDATLKITDMLVFPGDVFDRLLDYPSSDTVKIHTWMMEIFRLCKKYNIILRILEGTRSHDWEQSAHFIPLSAPFEIDIKYVRTLSIEHIDKFDIDILYVPDEWRQTCAETLTEVQGLLSKHMLSSVDLAIMHGQFKHQLPDIEGLDYHDIDMYSHIVKHCIIIGHIHFHTSLGIVVSPGSFDRLAHGEEGPKGGLLCDLSESGSKWRLLQNKIATTFKTIRIPKSYSIERADELLKKKFAGLRPGSNVRIMTHSSSPYTAHIPFIRDKYPQLNITKDRTDKIKRKERPVGKLKSYAELTIKKENLPAVFKEYIKDKFPPNRRKAIQNTLEKYL